MARATRNAKIDTRTARAELARGKRYSVKISDGLAVVYRRPRGSETAGSWYVRLARPGNRYTYSAIGEADDFRDANGSTILDYFQAQEQAREAAERHERERSTYLVRHALADYFDAYPGRRESVPRLKASVEPHILDSLGDRPVTALETDEISAWLRALVKAPARIRGAKRVREAPEDEEQLSEHLRRRRATANRIFGVLRAALNHAWRERSDIRGNEAWRKVRPFRGVTRGRVDFLRASEARKVIAECPPDLRALVRGALLTGARPGELRAIRVEDFDPHQATIYIRQPKVERSRYVPLNDEGREFFSRLTAGRAGDDRMFLTGDGAPWEKDDPRRPLIRACNRAKVKPVNVYALRHTFATLLLAENVSMHYLAKLMGTSVKMIEDHYGHIVEELQRETVAKLPAFGLDDTNVSRIA